ncbi:DUF1775 domain-containing protein [Micromonospora aurantiaca (nom. illeg.)]|uniref:DUF1775 domain-containing protein n=1 Tax=Micromonospora aurantiaca (nom. illeg.) TaxID=47850 RepID=UPI003F49F756
MTRGGVRAVTALTATVAALAVGSPAWAHTDATLSPARAGASNAVLTVNAEAENDSAGVVSVQVFLPEGVTAADVTLLKGPKGWKLTSAAGNYTVAGPAVPVGTDAEHQVRLRQLPNAPQVSFKILQKYSDGRIDRWIEVPTADNPEPANPAPTVKLAAAAPASPTAAPLTPSATPTATATAVSTGDAPVTALPDSSSADNTDNAVWVGLGAAAVALAVVTGLFVWWRRRRS